MEGHTIYKNIQRYTTDEHVLDLFRSVQALAGQHHIVEEWQKV